MLDGVQIPPGQFFWERGAHCKLYGHSVVTCVKSAEPIVMPFGPWAWTGPRNHELDGVQISPYIQSYSPGGANVPDNTLP